MHASFRWPNTPQLRWRFLRWSSFVEYMERVSRSPCTNSAYVFITSCIRLNLNEGFIGVRCNIMRSYFQPHMPFCCYNINYNNGDDGSLLIFVRWTYETDVVLSLDGQAVRLHCCVCARMRSCYWCSMQYVVVISPSSYGNDGSALIFVCWTYGTTGVVLALNQQLVRLYCCVCVCLSLKVLLISFWCGMRL